MNEPTSPETVAAWIDTAQRERDPFERVRRASHEHREKHGRGRGRMRPWLFGALPRSRFGRARRDDRTRPRARTPCAGSKDEPLEVIMLGEAERTSSGSGRTWDRTRDLPRVKRARPGCPGARGASLRRLRRTRYARIPRRSPALLTIRSPSPRALSGRFRGTLWSSAQMG